MIPFVCDTQNRQIYRDRKYSIDQWLPRLGGRVEMGSNCQWGTGFLWGMIKLDSVYGCTTCEYAKSQRTINFKVVNFMLCELHLN